ncbi:hypothetical protein PIB30_093774 [Stylosanthes scabra]|uniref:Uncharacterized protein n=1 Tax=Stylosanthes scabra TaxID=79078 RepID=A0ABU6ZTW3_9FABA|nr:hypothetical protein [Stylosanthes scabra]
MGSFARRPGATISGGPQSLHTGTASGTTGGPEIIRFRSCPPTTPVSQPRNTLTDGWLPVVVNPRGAQMPDDVPPAATQERDPIVLPRDAPARERRAQMQRLDIRGRVSARPQTGGRMRSRAETMLTRRLSTVNMRKF